MSDFGQRLQQAREHAKLTQGQLGDRVGLHQSQISKLERGERAASLKIVELAAACGVRLAWLRSGRGPMTGTGKAVVIERGADYPPIPLVRFRLRTGEVGFEVETIEDDVAPVVFRSSWYEQRALDPEKLYATRTPDAAMVPTMYERDIVVLNTEDVTPVIGAVFGFNVEGQFAVRRLHKDRGEWVLRADNGDRRLFPDMASYAGITILGRIVHRQSETI